MQSPTRNSATSSIPSQRQRCGACTAFCPAPDVATSLWGICAHTNGNDKVAGSVKRDQTLCVFAPSKFKAKEFRV